MNKQKIKRSKYEETVREKVYIAREFFLKPGVIRLRTGLRANEEKARKMNDPKLSR